MTAEKLSSVIYVSDEGLIDAGLDHDGSAFARWSAAQEASLLRWQALPWRVRVWRRFQSRMVEPRHRVRHAWRALRGEECYQ